MADNQITPFQLTDQFTMDNFNQRINETNIALQKKADTSVIDQIENDVNVLESRMNEFTSLPQGSTSGDAELADIRVGQDGTVYGTAGNAVRAQVNQLKQDFSNQQIKKYNAVTLGCKNDGSTDCSIVIQNILDNNGNIIIYFPVGTYRFDSSLYVRKDSSCQIIGETFSNDTFYINTNDIPVAKNGTVLWFNSSKTNISFINVQAGCISFRQKGICLYSKNGLFERDSDLNDRPYEPYNPYRYVSNISGQNGVSVVDCTKVEIDECAIIGFTSCGLALYTTNIVRDTYIRYCGIAIDLKNHDVSLYNTYITQCKGGVRASGGNTIFAYNIWIDQCVEYGVYKFGKLNGIITGLIDHCGYSGIRLDESDGLRLDLRIGRCGMYYADSVEGIKGNSSELGKSAFVKIGTCRHGEFTLSLYERSIGDDEINEYMLPKIVLAGTTWENVCVMGLNAEENYYIFSDTFSTGTNITCYTSKGIISKKI